MNREQRCTGDKKGERLLRASRAREVTEVKIHLCCTVLITRQGDQHDGIRSSKLLASFSSEIIFKVFRLSLGQIKKKNKESKNKLLILIKHIEVYQTYVDHMIPI